MRVVMIVVMAVIVAFMLVIVSVLVRVFGEPLGRFRLGIVFERICRTQRFAFQAQSAPIQLPGLVDGCRLPGCRLPTPANIRSSPFPIRQSQRCLDGKSLLSW
jgi:hypothetical protein